MQSTPTAINVSDLQDDQLRQFTSELVADGLKVYVNRAETSYCYFTDGVNIGYAQFDWQGASISTVHEQNRYTGTGFVVMKGGRATPDDARRAFAFAPSWASETDRRQVKKYRDFESFAKTHWSDFTEVK